MNIKKETIEKLAALGFRCHGTNDSCMLSTLRGEITFSKSTLLIVYDEHMSMWMLKTPTKKEVTTDWILQRVQKNTEKAYINLKDYIIKMFPKFGNAYAASYGVGVELIFRDYKKDIEKVETTLKKLGLKFRTEYSDAFWVFRFIVSKSKENIAILEAI